MVCFPDAGFGHVMSPEQPAATPVPLHVVTPSLPVSSSVVPGSQIVGGHMGTHWLPWIIVNGPHIAVPTMSSAGAHVPSRSIVPVPHSMLLQAGAVVVTKARNISEATRMNQPS